MSTAGRNKRSMLKRPDSKGLRPLYVLAKLSRYEARLSHRYFKALAHLRSIQDRRTPSDTDNPVCAGPGNAISAGPGHPLSHKDTDKDTGTGTITDGCDGQVAAVGRLGTPVCAGEPSSSLFRARHFLSGTRAIRLALSSLRTEVVRVASISPRSPLCPHAPATPPFGSPNKSRVRVAA